MADAKMQKFQGALLLITNPIRSHIPSVLSTVLPLVEKNLYIYFSDLTEILPAYDVEKKKKRVHPMLHTIYKQLSSTKDPSVDVLLHNVGSKNKLNNQIQLPQQCQAVFTVCSNTLSTATIRKDCLKKFGQLARNFELRCIEEKDSKDDECNDIQSVRHDKGLFNGESTKQYSRGVLGGTFDRLHNGHKLLLTECALLCDEKLVIGITDGPMIQNKILAEVIESYKDRSENVRSFINSIQPNLDVYCERIEDPYGPSITMENLNCIIVTEETEEGAELVNKKRQKNDLLELPVHVVSMVPADDDNQDEDNKLSSTTLRRQMLSILLKPSLKPAKSDQPYIIGLTGGIGSGKSSIARRIEKLGAAIVDCDKLGHETYKVDTDVYRKIIDTFGEDIVNPTDRSIDRKILGKKVFQSPDQLKKLTDIVWPAILDLAQGRIEQLFNEGKHIIVLDAAVLIEAKWTVAVNEIWIASIPPKEAIRRVVERDHISEDEAKRRLNAQMSNQDRFPYANVLLCTYWAESVTQKQVEKAWELLLERIKSHS